MRLVVGSVALAVAGFAAGFFSGTFLGIVTLLVTGLARGSMPDLAIAYRYVGLTTGVVGAIAAVVVGFKRLPR